LTIDEIRGWGEGGEERG